MPFLGTRGAGSSKAFDPGAGRPNQVTGLSATDFGTSRAYNSGRIDLSWSTPANNGAPITGYLIERSTDGSSYSTLVANTGTTSTTYSDTGLNSAQIYYYKVSAINPVGTGDVSSVASATATTVPQAPTIGTATGGNASATVTYTAGATGGKVISVYTATSSPGSFTGTGTSPITVSGLTNGTAYTFKVKATNANGTSLESAASNSVTPAAPVPVVSGGSLTSDATYYYRTFTGSGTLGISGGTLVYDAQYWGGGGSGDGATAGGLPGLQRAISGGGGGGGRVVLSSISANSNQTVTVGAGGAGGINGATNGSPTQIGSNAQAVGGGRGGGTYKGNALNGGSGGGGGNVRYTLKGARENLFYAAGTGTAGQGNNGGASGDADVPQFGGGGGGTSSNGASGTSSGVGGDGALNYAGVYCGIGGSGGRAAANTQGGAAGSSNNTGGTGQANRGNGGGGTYNNVNGSDLAGGAGGSGIVIVRYTRSQVGG